MDDILAEDSPVDSPSQARKRKAKHSNTTTADSFSALPAMRGGHQMCIDIFYEHAPRSDQMDVDEEEIAECSSSSSSSNSSPITFQSFNSHLYDSNGSSSSNSPSSSSSAHATRANRTSVFSSPNSPDKFSSGDNGASSPLQVHIYLLGGWNGKEDLGDFWRYDVATNEWLCLSRDTAQQGGPGPRSCHKICLDPLRRRIYALGRFLDPADLLLNINNNSSNSNSNGSNSSGSDNESGRNEEPFESMPLSPIFRRPRIGRTTYQNSGYAKLSEVNKVIPLSVQSI
jgi:hypothetical protein